MKSSLLKYRIKQAALISAFFSVYFVYLAARCRNYVEKKKVWPFHRYPSYQLRRTVQSIPNYNYNDPVHVMYSSSATFMDNSFLLKEKYSDCFSVFADKNVNLCPKNEKKELCKSLDIRIFIQQYFKEISSPTSSFKIFKRIKDYRSENESLDFYRDDEGVLSTLPKDEAENGLKLIGFMLSLAFATDSYLELNFTNYLLFNFADFQSYTLKELLENELQSLDEEQYSMYRKIKGASYSNKFMLVEDSPRPMRRPENNENSKTPYLYSKLYYSDEYPFDKAALEIFCKPYKKTRFLLDEGMRQIVFGYMSINGSINATREDFKVFRNYSYLNVVDWKNHSEYDKSTRMFWKALNGLGNDERMKIYTLVTGLERVPEGGFARLQKTRLIPHDKPSLKFDLYTIYLPTYYSYSEILNLINCKIAFN